jgi:hypothetical protein
MMIPSEGVEMASLASLSDKARRNELLISVSLCSVMPLSVDL